MITIALSKGRILKESLPILRTANINIDAKQLSSRSLALATNSKDIKFIILRASDVPIFVKHGSADLGITGKDVLLEKNLSGVYELLDLGIAKCRLMVAAKSADNLNKHTLKVATKYKRLTNKYFNEQAQQIELIKLYGAIELAPIVGLCDCIVDLVGTGNTLKANSLLAIKHITNISARLITNKAAYVNKHGQIISIVNALKNASIKY